MSRVIAAAEGVATPIHNPIHLTMQVGPTGTTALVVSSEPSPFPDRTFTMTRKEFQTFNFLMLHVLGLNNSANHGGFRRFTPIHDTTLEILYFLYADIASRIAPQLSPHEQLKCTAVALCASAPARDYSARPAVCLFDFSADLKANSLVNAALNADLKAVIGILEKTNPTKLDELLRASSTAITTHFGSERTGTALQMALFSGDEAMVKALQPHMNPGEFQRQWIEVFGTDYNAFLERQKNQAVQLCAELEAAFRGATGSDIANAVNPVPETTSELQRTLSRFQQTLEHYVRENPVHNPFILQILFEIYDRLPFDQNKDVLFSQQAIWPAEKLSSAAWLQHLAEGIYQIVEQTAPLDRSFLLQGGTPRVDIRSLVDSGVNCCVDMFGRGADGSTVARFWSWYNYQTFVEQKHHQLGETYAASGRAPVCNSVAR
jgi:hypothetical protein